MDNFKDVMKEIDDITTAENDFIANCANTASILWDFFNKINQYNINWIGFYYVRPYIRNKEKSYLLVLGPFQGKRACSRIHFGKGVCGNAALNKMIECVPDVQEYPGHIICDPASRSELAIPLIDNEENVVAILDFDSTKKNTFNSELVTVLKEIASLLVSRTKWKNMEMLY